ncbi:MAG: DUF4162 domain-containing protein [Acidobacteria bacterium]|nr:DUF4162 domain-containing protein [Acidobacteriota bacterium]
MTSVGPRRLVVRVEGDRAATWAEGIAGVTISEVTRGEVRLVLDADVDSNAVLDLARAAGRLTKFDFERRRLSELFRETVR